MKEVESHPMIKRLGKISKAKGNCLWDKDGNKCEIDAVIWATGFRQNFDWLEFKVTNSQGKIDQYRGLSQQQDNLYFVGLKLLHRVGSSLVGSGWKDSKYVANVIAQKTNK